MLKEAKEAKTRGYVKKRDEPVLVKKAAYEIKVGSSGYTVMETTELVVADVDIKKPWWDFLGRTLPGEFRKVLDRIRKRFPKARIYRTQGGYHVLAPTVMEPEQAEQWLRDVGADPLYIKLCRAYGNYRMRVSPKQKKPGRWAVCELVAEGELDPRFDEIVQEHDRLTIREGGRLC